MAERRLVRVLIAVLVAACVTAGLPAIAGARLAATVTLTTLTPKIERGAQPTFRYSTTGDVDSVHLELLVGSTWTDVADRLPGTNKTVRAPAPTAIGKYTYRMRAFKGSAEVARTAHNHDVYVFRDILIQTLCSHTVGNRKCVLAYVTVNGSKIAMYMSLAALTYPNFFSSAQYDHTSCRSAALSFTTKTSAVKSWLKLTQGTTAHIASTPPNTMGHLSVSSLNSNALYFAASVAKGTQSVYVNGTMNCWTTTGTY